METLAPTSTYRHTRIRMTTERRTEFIDRNTEEENAAVISLRGVGYLQ